MRRPEFEPAPEPSPESDEIEPTFADEPVTNIPGYSTGVVGDRRAGRRLAQIRRSMGEHQPSRAATGQLPTFERHYLMTEIRRITITTAALLTLIVVLAIVIR